MRSLIGWTLLAGCMALYAVYVVVAIAKAWCQRRAKPQSYSGPAPMSDEEYTRILALYDDEGGER